LQRMRTRAITYLIIWCISLSPTLKSDPTERSSDRLALRDTVRFHEINSSNKVTYDSCLFTMPVNYNNKIFEDSASFDGAHFLDRTRFDHTIFHEDAIFNEAIFEDNVYFHKSTFNKTARYFGTTFKQKTTFNNSKFKTPVFFHNVQFQDSCNFIDAHFDGPVNFYKTQFNSFSDFSYTWFKDSISFYFSEINGPFTLQNAVADNILFHGTIIRDKLYLGNNVRIQIPTVDLTKASFAQNIDFDRQTHKKMVKSGKIVLVGPVHLALQSEKFKNLTLLKTLDYFSKKNIIETLKENSYSRKNQATERFELDYILARSIMYQEKTSAYSPYRPRHILKWLPAWLCSVTMGFGYRPFKLFWWAFGIVLIFMTIYAWKIPKRLEEFIALEWKHKRTKENKEQASKYSIVYDNLLTAFYFSNAIFFALRFNKDIFNYFDRREKVLISIEWLLGIIFYFIFFTQAKSGSILHRLWGMFI
jgi:hypothetical protein